MKIIKLFFSKNYVLCGNFNAPYNQSDHGKIVKRRRSVNNILYKYNDNNRLLNENNLIKTPNSYNGNVDSRHLSTKTIRSYTSSNRSQLSDDANKFRRKLSHTYTKNMCLHGKSTKVVAPPINIHYSHLRHITTPTIPLLNLKNCHESTGHFYENGTAHFPYYNSDNDNTSIQSLRITHDELDRTHNKTEISLNSDQITVTNINNDNLTAKQKSSISTNNTNQYKNLVIDISETSYTSSQPGITSNTCKTKCNVLNDMSITNNQSSKSINIEHNSSKKTDLLKQSTPSISTTNNDPSLLTKAMVNENETNKTKWYKYLSIFVGFIVILTFVIVITVKKYYNPSKKTYLKKTNNKN